MRKKNANFVSTLFKPIVFIKHHIAMTYVGFSSMKYFCQDIQLAGQFRLTKTKQINKQTNN